MKSIYKKYNLPSIPDQLLGASVDILPSGATFICAPGYSVENQTISSGKTKYNPGRCFHKANFYTRVWTEVMPCSNYKFEMSFNGGGRSQCTSGIASKLLDDDNILVSAPGADYRVFVKHFRKIDDNFGQRKRIQGGSVSLRKCHIRIENDTF